MVRDVVDGARRARRDLKGEYKISTRITLARATGNCARLAAVAVLLVSCNKLVQPAQVKVPADSAANEVSFRMSPRAASIIVSAYINGKGPVDLILDTGSTLTCLDESLAHDLKLPPRTGAMSIGAGVGIAGPLSLLKVDSLRVGMASATNITVCSLDLRSLQRVSPSARGLLGLNFLKSFRVNIDFSRHVLQLAAP